MQRKTRSLLEELSTLCSPNDTKYLLESRSTNIIGTAIQLIEQIEQTYDEETADILMKRFLNAIKTKDPSKFERALRKINESK